MSHDDRCAILVDELKTAAVRAGLFTADGTPLFRMPHCRCAADGGGDLDPAARELYWRFLDALSAGFRRAWERAAEMEAYAADLERPAGDETAT